MADDIGRTRTFRLVIILALLAGFTASLLWAFELGAMTALVAVGGGALVYSVPATIFDWPRLGWDDVAEILTGLLTAIGAFFSGLFDW